MDNCYFYSQEFFSSSPPPHPTAAGLLEGTFKHHLLSCLPSFLLSFPPSFLNKTFATIEVFLPVLFGFVFFLISLLVKPLLDKGCKRIITFLRCVNMMLIIGCPFSSQMVFSNRLWANFAELFSTQNRRTFY